MLPQKWLLRTLPKLDETKNQKTQKTTLAADTFVMDVLKSSNLVNYLPPQ